MLYTIAKEMNWWLKNFMLIVLTKEIKKSFEWQKSLYILSASTSYSFFFFWMFLPLLCSFSWTPIWAPYTYTTWWQGMGFIFVWTEKEEWIYTIGSTSMFPNTYPDLSSFRLCRSSYLTERNMVLLVRNDILERWGFSLIVHDITSCSIFIGKGM
jgi:hypothetical protein